MNSFILTTERQLSPDNNLVKDHEPIYVSGKRTAWKEQLIQVLSKNCGCTFLIEKDGSVSKTKYYLVGRKNNIAITRTLYEKLSNHIHELAISDMHGAGKIVINSYCLGFIEALKEHAGDTSCSTKLEQEAKHYMKLIHYYVPILNSLNNSKIDSIAFEFGKNKGKLIDLRLLISEIN